MLVLAMAMIGLLAGCSGTGAPTEPGGLAELRATADDQVTTALLVKRWFAILHVRRDLGSPSARLAASCDAEPWHVVPSLPTDPPGSTRSEGRLSDCTTMERLTCADGSGRIDYHLPDGREKTATWSAVRTEGDWTKSDWHQTIWGEATLDYEAGDNAASPVDDQYERGTAILVADGRTMHWDHERNTRRDELTLSLDDGASLSVEVPLHAVTGTVYWPVFTQGAPGTYTGASGRSQRFTFSGSEPAGWQECVFRLPDGTTGKFALASDFSGTGRIRREGQVLASLSWSASGQGVLRPVGADVIPAIASAAARAFAIDQWIRNVAELGPDPS
jgi:hypothetical protein